MSSNYNNPLSSISYTNKDFRAIFEELLDLTKKLTYKWDPSISNESDPGVILLKLNAIIGDKNNYNIDKNILEAFPETVTQEFSARSMYKQLAYQMPWYQSATTSVSFRWIGETLEPGEVVTIPAFTMVTNSDNSIIYTLVEDVEFSYGEDIASGKVMQGTITDLTVNGSTTFKLDNIDYSNRIYLNDYNVAENGIFISNAEESALGFWEKVENLQIEPINERYFEFGVDSRSNSTYVEFPSDIETLIRAGLNIKYLISDGLQGNVAAKEITKFYEDTAVEFRGEELALNEEVVQMYNPSATTDGEDPESVADAYNSYRRVAGTFDTLVTLRDYINAVYQSGIVSNDIVSDRLTDIQSSYTIMTDGYGSGDSVVEYGRFIDPNKDDMSPYDLKLYLLHNGGIINSISAFNTTIDMEPTQDTVAKQVENYIADTKCMQHNFGDLIENKPCMFRNLYSMKIKFVPQYQLSNIQIDSVKRNIIQSLYDTLNSREINFGEEPDYNLIYDTIVNSDERIKIITIDDFNYTTYATYWEETDPTDPGRFKSIPISDFSSDPWIITANTKEDFAAAIKDITTPAQYTYIATGEGNTVYKYNASKQTFEEYSKLIDDFRIDIITRSVLAGVTPLYDQENSFVYSIDQIFDHVDTDVDRVSTNLVLSPWGFNDDGTPKDLDATPNPTTREYTLKDNESIQFLAPSFVTEISYSNYVRFELVLKDKTSDESLFESANAYDFSATRGTFQGRENVTLWVARTDGGYDPYVNFGDTQHDETYGYVASTATSEGHAGSFKWFISTKLAFDSYGGGAEQIMLTSADAWSRDYLVLYTEKPAYIVYSDTDYKLKEGDSITFFWKETDEDDAPYVYRCYKGISPEQETEIDKSPIIRPTFTINGTGPEGTILIDPNKLTTTGTIPYNANQYSDYQKVYSMYGDNTLSGTKSIDIRKLNQVNIKKNSNYYYFITNVIEDAVISDIETTQYVMEFEAVPRFMPGKYYKQDSENVYSLVTTEPSQWGYGQTKYYEKVGSTYKEIKFEYDYTLKADEYFIYTNKDMTTYEILGSGTLIKLLENIYQDSLPRLTVQTVAYEDVAMMGLESFTDKTKQLSVDALVREQQIYNLTGGDSIAVQIDDDFEGMPYSQVVDGEVKEGIAYPYFTTTISNSINGLTVSYSTDGASFTELPGIEIEDESSNWVGTAILNIDTTYDDSQIIDNTYPDGVTSNENKQSLQQLVVRGTQNESEEFVGYYPPDPFNSTSEINILANVSLTKVGGVNIDVTYLDAYGERTNINLFAYELNPAFNTVPFSKTPEYGIRMNFLTEGLVTTDFIVPSKTGNLTNIQVNGIQLETGFRYLLGVRNTSASRRFWLLDSTKGTPGTYITCLNTTTNSDDKQNAEGIGLPQGKYYFMLDNRDPENEIKNLTIQIDGSDEVGFLEFDNLTKCTENEVFEEKYGIEPSIIEGQIPLYDYNGRFKYNYLVPVDKLIEDPLEAKKFFDENHVCNAYTIGQANLLIPSDSNANSKASSIDAINNR